LVAVFPLQVVNPGDVGQKVEAHLRVLPEEPADLHDLLRGHHQSVFAPEIDHVQKGPLEALPDLLDLAGLRAHDANPSPARRAALRPRTQDSNRMPAAMATAMENCATMGKRRSDTQRSPREAPDEAHHNWNGLKAERGG